MVGIHKTKDLSGYRFGHLIAVSLSHQDKYRIWYWNCICDCGKWRVVRAGRLRNGTVQSCGCSRKRRSNLSCESIYPENTFITGQRFGKLVIISFDHKDTQGHFFWKCLCDCGNLHIARSDRLKSGHTKTCGCGARVGKIIHGAYMEPLYGRWIGLRARCSNPKDSEYKNYGGRGIYVCDAWEDFYVFKEWALNHGFEEDLTIDRIDNNGPYSPENCRWVTVKVNNRNRRSCRIITYKGKVQCVSAWAEELGVSRSALWHRLNRNDWSMERALELIERAKERKKKRSIS